MSDLSDIRDRLQGPVHESLTAGDALVRLRRIRASITPSDYLLHDLRRAMYPMRRLEAFRVPKRVACYEMFRANPDRWFRTSNNMMDNRLSDLVFNTRAVPWFKPLTGPISFLKHVRWTAQNDLRLRGMVIEFGAESRGCQPQWVGDSHPVHEPRGALRYMMLNVDVAINENNAPDVMWGIFAADPSKALLLAEPSQRPPSESPPSERPPPFTPWDVMILRDVVTNSAHQELNGFEHIVSRQFDMLLMKLDDDPARPYVVVAISDAGPKPPQNP
ncbi:hypothetical protein KVR01_013003 [Diaporthe batatas]|uniref:uncharacterized protein n=1 Tax=Diaporthe batatas TaxID=748121 RepID=UPI001D04B3A5|nr:uncharacterized protein KVR01_013003 [Diaporthe batatas]KAG8157295.1 hypothetical protein KVR01_013003 [Diaporthe batatas]